MSPIDPDRLRPIPFAQPAAHAPGGISSPEPSACRCPAAALRRTLTTSPPPPASGTRIPPSLPLFPRPVYHCWPCTHSRSRRLPGPPSAAGGTLGTHRSQSHAFAQKLRFSRPSSLMWPERPLTSCPRREQLLGRPVLPNTPAPLLGRLAGLDCPEHAGRRHRWADRARRAHSAGLSRWRPARGRSPRGRRAGLRSRSASTGTQSPRCQRGLEAGGWLALSRGRSARERLGGEPEGKPSQPSSLSGSAGVGSDGARSGRVRRPGAGVMVGDVAPGGPFLPAGAHVRGALALLEGG